MSKRAQWVHFYAAVIASFMVVLGGPTLAHADSHFGPLVGYELAHRRSPEETDSVRFTWGVGLVLDLVDHWPLFESTISMTNGVDYFATQNSIEEKLYRLRVGVIVNPFKFESPLVGLRGGFQYALGTAVYNKHFPLSTDRRDPAYLSPYLGFIVGVTPLAGFGVEDEFTATYDTDYKAWVYQLTFGIPLK